MTKKHLFAFFLLILLTNKVFSQINISGQIKNQNNKPVELIEIQLQNKDSIIVKSELTNTDGKFTIITEKGKYLLLIKRLGTILHKVKVNTDQNINLGVIQITENQQNLQEVVITSKKKLIERKVDRLVYNVENSIASQGMSGTDVLRNTPLLRVDDKDGISIIGKSGVSVMVNGKMIQLSGIALTNYLQTLKSDNIAKIEVITTPPARYEAQGNSGIVNIILKKNTNIGWSGRLGSTTQRNTLFNSQNDLNINYQSPKLNFTANGYKIKNGFAPTGTRDVLSTTGDNIHTTANRIDNTSYDGFDFTTEYKINDKSDISMMFEWYQENYDMDSKNISIYDVNNIPSYTLDTDAKQRWKKPSLTFDLFYDIKLDTLGKKLSLAGNVLKSTAERNDGFHTVDSSSPTVTNVLTNSNMDYGIYSGQFDFTLPYKWSSIETGGKINLLKNNAILEYKDKIGNDYINDLTKGNAFDYNEYNYALYVSAEKEINEKWSAKAGLRYEWTNSNGFNKSGDHINKKYGYLFPTAYLSYNPNTNHNFSVNFSTRINRPNMSDMNPSRWYSNPNMYSEGNVNLQPSISYNCEFNYVLKNKLTFSLYNQYSINEIAQVPIFDGKVYSNTKRNAFNTNNTGLITTYANTFFSRWELSISANVFYNNAKSIIPELISMKQYSMTYNITNNVNINKSKTLAGSLNFFHNLPSIYGTTYLKSIYGLSAGLRLSLLEKSLKMNLSVSDILKTSKSDGYTNYNGFTEYLTQYNDYRKVTFGCSYSFGDKKVKKVTQSKDFEENNRK
jgi:outer membrane receptor protein involved in Fe transport